MWLYTHQAHARAARVDSYTPQLCPVPTPPQVLPNGTISHVSDTFVSGGSPVALCPRDCPSPSEARPGPAPNLAGGLVWLCPCRGGRQLHAQAGHGSGQGQGGAPRRLAWGLGEWGYNPANSSTSTGTQWPATRKQEWSRKETVGSLAPLPHGPLASTPRVDTFLIFYLQLPITNGKYR